jgi:hypothetical protein
MRSMCGHSTVERRDKVSQVTESSRSIRFGGWFLVGHRIL